LRFIPPEMRFSVGDDWTLNYFADLDCELDHTGEILIFCGAAHEKATAVT